MTYLIEEHPTAPPWTRGPRTSSRLAPIVSFVYTLDASLCLPLCLSSSSSPLSALPFLPLRPCGAVLAHLSLCLHSLLSKGGAKYENHSVGALYVTKSSYSKFVFQFIIEWNQIRSRLVLDFTFAPIQSIYVLVCLNNSPC